MQGWGYIHLGHCLQKLIELRSLILHRQIEGRNNLNMLWLEHYIGMQIHLDFCVRFPSNCTGVFYKSKLLQCFD